MTTSVALCTYNGEKYLVEQLESILSQDIPVDEIVICDDGSTDQTSSILKRYQKMFPDIIRLFFNEENLGYVSNFEKAITLCTKGIIFLCDQDDIWSLNKVGEIKEVFSKNVEVKVLCHNFTLLTEEGYKKNYWKERDFSPNLNNENILKTVLFKGNIFPGMAMIISKSAQQEYLPLKKINDIIIHDFELIIKSARDHSLFVLDENLGFYRLHENQNIGFINIPAKKYKTATELYEKMNSIERVNNLVLTFKLDGSLPKEYEKTVAKYYFDYLKQFPIWRRIYIQLKLKHYYKLNTTQFFKT